MIAQQPSNKRVRADAISTATHDTNIDHESNGSSVDVVRDPGRKRDATTTGTLIAQQPLSKRARSDASSTATHDTNVEHQSKRSSLDAVQDLGARPISPPADLDLVPGDDVDNPGLHSTVGFGAANLGAANLGAANLGAANLGAAKLGAANLGAANSGAANLGSANFGSDVLLRHAAVKRVRRKGLFYCDHVEGEALCNHEVHTVILSTHIRTTHASKQTAADTGVDIDEDDIAAANAALGAQRDPNRFYCDVPDPETKVICNTSTSDQRSADRHHNGVHVQRRVTRGVPRVYSTFPRSKVPCKVTAKSQRWQGTSLRTMAFHCPMTWTPSVTLQRLFLMILATLY